jgi:hypothetical protein
MSQAERNAPQTNEERKVPEGQETYPRCGHTRSYERWNLDLECPCGE